MILKDLIKDKRGGEKWLSIWWFLSLIVIAIGIVGSVAMFFSANVDTRGFEASLLYDKISSCILDDEEFLLNPNNFNLIEMCSLNEYIFENEERIEHYLSVSVKDKNGEPVRDKISYGNNGYKNDCELILDKPEVEAKNFPNCVKRIERVNFLSQGKIIDREIEILVATNQKGRKVPVT